MILTAARREQTKASGPAHAYLVPGSATRPLLHPQVGGRWNPACSCAGSGFYSSGVRVWAVRRTPLFTLAECGCGRAGVRTMCPASLTVTNEKLDEYVVL